MRGIMIDDKNNVTIVGELTIAELIRISQSIAEMFGQFRVGAKPIEQPNGDGASTAVDSVGGGG